MNRSLTPLDDPVRNRMLAELAYRSTDMISRHTPDGWRFIDASPAIETLLGYSTDEIIGVAALDLYHPDDAQIFINRSKQVRYQKGIYTHTYRFLSKSGKYVWLESTSRTIRDPKTRKIKEILVVSRDVGHRMATDQTNNRLVQIIETTNDLVLSITPHYQIRYLNTSATQTLHIPYSDIHADTDLNLQHYLPPQDWDVFLHHAIPYALEHNSWRGELSLRSREGDAIPVGLEIICHFSSLWRQRSVEYFSLVARDLTQAKKAERELQKYKTTVEHAEKLIVLGEMASSMAHELNQPLTAIINYSRGLRNRLDKSTLDLDILHQTLAKITETALRSGAIIHRIMDFARKKNALKIETIDIEKTVLDIIAFCQHKAQHQAVQIELVPTRPKLFAKTDRIQVEQILLNLLVNAIESYQHSSIPDKKVYVHLNGWQHQQIKITIQDFGSTLPENIDQLFESFYTTKSAGLGMGLAISKSLVEQLGGELWAESDPRQGTCFSFTLNQASAPSLEES